VIEDGGPPDGVAPFVENPLSVKKMNGYQAYYPEGKTFTDWLKWLQESK